MVLSAFTLRADLIRRSAGSFNLETTIKGEKIKQKVYYCGPRRIKSSTPVVIVMHGNKRNADDYRDAWEDYAEEEELLVLVPEFDERTFPGSRGYNMGGIMSCLLYTSPSPRDA